MDLQRGKRASFPTVVAAATPSEPKSKDHTEATMQETTGVARTSNVEGRNELRSYGSRGRMLLCWCRDGGKHRPIYWEKIVPWREKKRQTSEQTWAHSSARNLISVPGEDGVEGWEEGKKKGKEKKNKNKHCFPVSGPDGTQRGAGVKEPLGLRHREEDD